jgi:hypothetical protein
MGDALERYIGPIRISRRTWDHLRREADRRGMTMGGYLRMLAIRDEEANDVHGD